jgi:hypothetical protein
MMVLLYRVLYIAMYPAIIIGYMEMSSRTNGAGTNENDQIVRPVKKSYQRKKPYQRAIVTHICEYCCMESVISALVAGLGI